VTAWLGVVSAEHVARGVSLGIAQVNHGKRAPLARMRAGDGLVYYSPRRSLDGQQPVQAFTAVGRLADDVLWQADEGSFKPWRRRVRYADGVRWVPLADLRDRLDLTAAANWGYQLRRGLVPLSNADFALIHAELTGGEELTGSAPATGSDARSPAPQPAGLW